MLKGIPYPRSSAPALSAAEGFIGGRFRFRVIRGLRCRCQVTSLPFSAPPRLRARQRRCFRLLRGAILFGGMRLLGHCLGYCLAIA